VELLLKKPERFDAVMRDGVDRIT
ncbi:MAG: hypothetical protein K1060chlam2_00847, partial [Chlamydiae bacterium]|nr:hypothetical protein [Chlamydiota bacterium]